MCLIQLHQRSRFAACQTAIVLRPALKAAYSAAEVVAQAAEEIEDMVAEARAEHEQPPSKEAPHMTH